ncbi:MAG TPA: glycosyltransferase family 2 protein [Solirubrobacteraceae bacterium]
MGPDAIAIVVVTHGSAEHMASLASAVQAQLRDRDEFVIVDNASNDGTPDIARSLTRATVIESGQNLGFAGGCHVGAQATNAPLLLFLNPDCRMQPGCLERLREAARIHPEWSAWQAVVMLDEARINTSGGVVHFLGIGWAGDCEASISALPDDDQEVAFPSGAAMVVRREAWLALKGMDPTYFMYGEDLDFGLRLWLAGHRVGLAQAARAVHGYEFDKGSYKWFYLERNRWRTLLSVYPASLLLLLAPALLASELGLLVIAARGGWLGSKLRALVAAAAELPHTLVRRRAVQSTRQIGAAEFAAHLTASLDSPYLETAGSVRCLQAAYWRLVRRAMALFRA